MGELDIVGRSKEKALLHEVLGSPDPAFIAVYGRRRIGKTFLIRNFFKDKGVYFQLTGIYNANSATQLRHFSVEMADRFHKGKPQPTPKNWTEAFITLRQEIDKVPPETKVILFFDELPWLASQKSGFLSELEHFWNRHMSDRKNLILIVCGSATSWVMNHVIRDKGGLHNRVTLQLPMYPFDLRQTKAFLEARNIQLDDKQLTELYMALGGVAQYLSYVKRGESASQTIDRLCFHPDGALYNEFPKLYRSLFTNYEDQIAIVEALASRRRGMAQKDLAKLADMKLGGTFSKRLKELEESGFISRVPLFGKKSSPLYVLTDEYSLFYLSWIAKATDIDLRGAQGSYWQKKVKSPAWRAWSGFAFESLCLKHIDQIKHALGIAAVSTKSTRWTYLPKDSEREDGAEIDLVIDRADNCINLCELKYSAAPFVIDKEYGKKLRHKKHSFATQTGTRKALFTTLVTTYGVKKNSHSLGIVDSEVTVDSLFAS